VVLAIAGSMTFEGEVIGWVATHHRHHAIVITPRRRPQRRPG
jgi:stearoyl-CoA desaturase (delta-9 desaturase)